MWWFWNIFILHNVYHWLSLNLVLWSISIVTESEIADRQIIMFLWLNLKSIEFFDGLINFNIAPIQRNFFHCFTILTRLLLANLKTEILIAIEFPYIYRWTYIRIWKTSSS